MAINREIIKWLVLLTVGGIAGYFARAKRLVFRHRDPTDVRTHLRQAFEDTGDPYDDVFPGRTDDFLEKLAVTYEELNRVGSRLKEKHPADKRNTNEWRAAQYSWQLLWGAANELLGGFLLLRRGYPIGPLTIARQVMERVMVAVVLYDNPGLIPEFQAGREESLYKKWVGPVSKVINDFGKAWGMLSKLGAHVSHENVASPVIEVSGEGAGPRLALRVGGHLGDPGRDNDMWLRITQHYLWIASILAIAPEQIYLNAGRTRAAIKANPTKK